MRRSLEDFSQNSSDFLLKPGLNIKSTILIAKSLVQLRDVSLYYPNFFLLLQHFVRHTSFTRIMLEQNFKNITDLIYAFAHMREYLDKATDWEEIILDMFC